MNITKKVAFFVTLSFVFTLNFCAVGGQSFKSRYNEGDADSDIRSWGARSAFAESTHSLQTFKNRYNQGDSDSDIRSWGARTVFAGSKHSL